LENEIVNEDALVLVDGVSDGRGAIIPIDAIDAVATIEVFGQLEDGLLGPVLVLVEREGKSLRFAFGRGQTKEAHAIVVVGRRDLF
jgi:hypothetical protein